MTKNEVESLGKSTFHKLKRPQRNIHGARWQAHEKQQLESGEVKLFDFFYVLFLIQAYYQSTKFFYDQLVLISSNYHGQFLQVYKYAYIFIDHFVVKHSVNFFCLIIILMFICLFMQFEDDSIISLILFYQFNLLMVLHLMIIQIQIYSSKSILEELNIIEIQIL